MIDDSWGRTAFLVVGWLLGLLSPQIVESIRRARDMKPMQASLADELHEFRFTTACTAHVLRTHLGTADREFLKWFKGATEDYQGIRDARRFRDAASTYLNLADDQLEAVLRLQAGNTNDGLHMRSLDIVGLDARLPSLWMFPRRSQTELLRLLHEVSIYNGESEKADHYQKLTFQASSENHEIAKKNLRGTYVNLASVAQRIADQAARCETGLRSGKWPMQTL